MDQFGHFEIHTPRTTLDAMTVDAELLSRWRTLGARHSEEVLDLAPRVLKSGNLGEQGITIQLEGTVQVS